MWNVTLEIPLVAFPFSRSAQRDYAANPRIQAFRNTLNNAALAGGIAALKDHGNFQAFYADPFLKFDKFDLQVGKLLDIFVFRGRFSSLGTTSGFPVTLDFGVLFGVS